MAQTDTDELALTRVARFWTRLLRGPGPGVRADVYRGLATLLEAGFGAREATERLAERGTFTAALRAAAEDGRPLSTGLAATDGMATETEVAVLGAGERTGRSEEALRRLAAHLDSTVKTRRLVATSLAYPVLVLHVALLLPTIPLVWTPHGFGAWIRLVLIGLAVIWGLPLVGISVYAALRNHPSWSRLFCRIPAAGRAIHCSAVARFAWTLGSLHDAGILHDEAIAVAGRAASLGWLRRDVQSAPDRLRGGEPLPVVLAGAGALPADLRDMISTGDATGTLSEGMVRAGALYDERAGRAAMAAAIGVGAITYAIAVLVVVGLAFSVIGGYYGTVNDMLK